MKKIAAGDTSELPDLSDSDDDMIEYITPNSVLELRSGDDGDGDLEEGDVDSTNKRPLIRKESDR